MKPDRTYCQTGDALALIDKATSFYEEGYMFSPQFRNHVWDGRKHLFRKTDKSFPSGLLSHVCLALEKKGLTYSIVTDFELGKITEYHGLPGVEDREYQNEAIHEGLMKHRGIFHMATNAGKTTVMAGLATCVLGKILVLTHRLELLHQTSSRLRDMCVEPVGICGDSSWDDTQRITVAMIPTLSSRMKGDTKKAKFMRTEWIKQFNCLMVDECHHMGASTWYDIAMRCDAPWRFGFSGTPIRTDNRDMMLAAAAGPVIYTTTNKDLIDAGVSAQPIVRFAPIHQPVIIPTKNQDWPDAYKNGIVENTFRNAKGVDLAIRHCKRDEKILLLVTEIDHGERLQKMFECRDYWVEFIHGGCEPRHRKDSLKAFKNQEGGAILIASTILDEGIDIPTIDVIVMLGAGKSPIKMLQRIGRGLRKKESGKLYVYDFLDLMDVDRVPPKRKNQKPKHGFLTNHAIQRYTYLKSQAGFDVKLLEKEETESVLN